MTPPIDHGALTGPDPRRRSLLAAALAGGLLARPFAADAGAAGSATVRLFSNPAAAGTLGRRYLELYPGERAAVDTLRRRVALDVPAEDLAAKRAGIARRIRREFAAGRTVDVDGWILSRLEARLCATLA